MKLTSAVATSHDLSFRQQETLFNKNSVFLQSLVRIAVTGLGTDKTVAGHTSGGISIIRDEEIKPLVRNIVHDDLFAAVIVDESPGKNLGGRGIGLVHLYAPNMTAPVAIDLTAFESAVNSVSLRQFIWRALTAEGFFTPQEFCDHVVVLTGDHAPASSATTGVGASQSAWAAREMSGSAPSSAGSSGAPARRA